MTMPSRVEATALLAEYGDGSAWSRHCRAVADAAEAVGAGLDDGRAVDGDALWSAALLHDIGRYATHDPIMHGVEGYRLLVGLGHEDAAYVCASHIAFGLRASEAVRFGLPDQDFLPRTDLERIVPLVDLLIDGERPTSLDARLVSLRERNVDHGEFLGMLDRAQSEAASFLAQLDADMARSVEEVVASCCRHARGEA